LSPDCFFFGDKLCMHSCVRTRRFNLRLGAHNARMRTNNHSPSVQQQTVAAGFKSSELRSEHQSTFAAELAFRVGGPVQILRRSAPSCTGVDNKKCSDLASIAIAMRVRHVIVHCLTACRRDLRESGGRSRRRFKCVRSVDFRLRRLMRR
jgi:hypothetical protein